MAGAGCTLEPGAVGMVRHHHEDVVVLWSPRPHSATLGLGRHRRIPLFKDAEVSGVQ